MNMTVASLWRYPVKTLPGELIQTVRLTLDGIPGDRIVHVRGPEGVRTSLVAFTGCSACTDHLAPTANLSSMVSRGVLPGALERVHDPAAQTRGWKQMATLACSTSCLCS